MEFILELIGSFAIMGFIIIMVCYLADAFWTGRMSSVTDMASAMMFSMLRFFARPGEWLKRRLNYR
jgi:hypothetical protein